MDQVYGPFVSRQQALHKGLTHYFDGKPCRRGHVCIRYTCGGCFECRRIRVGYTGVKSLHGRDPAKLEAKKQKAARATKAKRATEEGRLRRNEVERARYARLTQDKKLAATLRARVREALRWSGAQKSEKTMALIGCTITELKAHLESQFLPGMSWSNWTTDGWHIDHIRPCASFDLTDPEQQKTCFHYSNLQPLWALDNLRKAAS